MSLDQQLPDLLTDAAKGADAAPPSIDGVHAALGRRTRRRRRQRLAGSVVAVAVVAAGIVGGVAVARRDEPDRGTVDDPVEGLPEAPILGIEREGWELRFADELDDVLGGEAEPVVPYAFFSEGDELFGAPVITVAIGPEGELDTEEERTPVDLDGDGATDGPGDGWILPPEGGTSTVAFVQGDGSTVGITGFGVPEDDLLAYASTVAAADLGDVTGTPSPPGFDTEILTEFPADGARHTYATYRVAGGGQVGISTTNQPGWGTITQFGSNTFTEVPLGGDSLLGPGRAAVDASGEGASALILTDAGLTVEIHLDDSVDDAGLLRSLLADAPFVELEPRPVETPTTTVPPTTTGPDRVIDLSGDVLPPPRRVPPTAAGEQLLHEREPLRRRGDDRA